MVMLYCDLTYGFRELYMTELNADFDITDYITDLIVLNDLFTKGLFGNINLGLVTHKECVEILNEIMAEKPEAIFNILEEVFADIEELVLSYAAEHYFKDLCMVNDKIYQPGLFEVANVRIVYEEDIKKED